MVQLNMQKTLQKIEILTSSTKNFQLISSHSPILCSKTLVTKIVNVIAAAGVGSMKKYHHHSRIIGWYMTLCDFLYKTVSFVLLMEF